jgi:maltose O-acetyltransferase
MSAEKQKMLAGELYDPLDPLLCEERQRARDLCQDLNASREDQIDERRRILAALFGQETDVWIQPPFFCDYGTNIALGKKVFFNFNCVVLDVMAVSIGDNVLFGPSVQIYTATHPISAVERRRWLESARPVTIGSDVWVGGAAIICPGVKIGSRSVIGAGSVVTRDIPDDVFAAGNPCRVIRTLESIPEAERSATTRAD